MATTRASKEERVSLFPSTRFSVYCMLLVTSILHYAIRFALNMSIVCMVVPQHHKNITANESYTVDSADSNFTSQCDVSLGKKKYFGYEGEFYWSRAQVGYILGAFFYAYMPTQLVAGWMADKFGIRHVLGTGMLVGGILSLLTPVAARVHYGLLIALRLAMGWSLGVMFPCVHSCIGKWVPVTERSTFVGCVFGGPSAGIIISYIMSGYLCQYSWTYVFYIQGSATLLWYIAFLWFVYSSPDEHPRISEKEKLFIKQNSNMTISASTSVEIPWKSILTSRSVLGLCVSQISSGWLFYTISTGIPLYMQDVLYFNIKANGLLSSLPPLIKASFSVVFGIAFDLCHRYVIKSKRIIRIVAHTGYSLCPAVGVIVVGFIGCEQRVIAIVVFCLMYFSFCFRAGGISCGPSDIAPRMAGAVYGVINFCGNCPGIFAPMAIGNLTSNGTQSEWQLIFGLCGGIMCVGWLSFVFCVGVEEEAWARGDTQVAEIDVPDEELSMMSGAKQRKDNQHAPDKV